MNDFRDEENFDNEAELEAAYFVYQTLIDQGFSEREAIEKAGLSKKDLQRIIEKELEKEFEEGEDDEAFGGFDRDLKDEFDDDFDMDDETDTFNDWDEGDDDF